MNYRMRENIQDLQTSVEAAFKRQTERRKEIQLSQEFTRERIAARTSPILAAKSPGRVSPNNDDLELPRQNARDMSGDRKIIREKEDKLRRLR